MSEIPDPQSHLAWFQTSPGYLASVMHLPSSAQILGIQMMAGDSIRILVMDPENLPAKGEGEEAPEVTPTIQYHRERWDFDWGLPIESEQTTTEETT